MSLRGAVPLSWTLDHAGPMARTVQDTAITLAAIAGYDPADPVSVDHPLDDYLADLESGVRGLRIALAVPSFLDQADPVVAAAVREAVAALGRAGARVSEIALPRTAELRDTQRVILGTDAAAFHRDRIAAQRAGYGDDVAQRTRRNAANSRCPPPGVAPRTGLELRSRGTSPHAEIRDLTASHPG